ncbi:MAG: hypothetical protein L0Y58_18595 [Verrucomicrobia subdivision 3 bacterium]|nr:hypothetical protein [Limisphaerales bacterium]
MNGIAKAVLFAAPARLSLAGASLEFHAAKDWLSSSAGELDSSTGNGSDSLTSRQTRAGWIWPDCKLTGASEVEANHATFVDFDHHRRPELLLAVCWQPGAGTASRFASRSVLKGLTKISAG